MDPVTVLSVLGSLAPLARAAAQKFESLDKLLTEREKFAQKYKKSVRAFAAEVDDIEVLLKTMVVRGDNTALARLMQDGDGREAFNKLSHALTAAQDLLEGQERAANKLIARINSKRKEIGGFNLTFEYGGTGLADLKEVVESAFTTLEDQRAEISRMFSLFHRLYLIHQAPITREHHKEDGNTPNIEQLLDAIQVYFYSHPFAISAARADEIKCLHNLNFSTVAQRHAETMEVVGRCWVEDQLRCELTVGNIGRVQIELMGRLHNYLTDLTSPPPSPKPCDQEDRLRLGFEAVSLRRSISKDVRSDSSESSRDNNALHSNAVITQAELEAIRMGWRNKPAVRTGGVPSTQPLRIERQSSGGTPLRSQLHGSAPPARSLITSRALEVPSTSRRVSQPSPQTIPNRSTLKKGAPPPPPPPIRSFDSRAEQSTARRTTTTSAAAMSTDTPRAPPRGTLNDDGKERRFAPVNNTHVRRNLRKTLLGTGPTMPAIEPSAPADALALGSDQWQASDMMESIERAVKRAKGQKFSIGFCGMVKAGKSLFLNALMGRMILPSNELPSTAWPCRLRHVKDQLVPRLEVDRSSFLSGIKALQVKKYGRMMERYIPPADDPFAGILDGAPTSNPLDPEEGEMRIIYSRWVDLHSTTRANLLIFEKEGFELAGKAEGEEAVCQLLGELNDIVRLCHRMQIPFDMEKSDWPLLSVEFDSLRDKDIDGVFEFIDLPGIGESFDDYDFEELIRRVAKEVNAIVPIVSFKEVPKEDWRKLPAIIQAGIGRAPDIVLCTHLDQITQDNLPEQFANVAKIFWPGNPGGTNRVLPCSSKMGLSAHTLLRQSATSKPDFNNIWHKRFIVYDCAEKILGVGSPQPNFESFTLKGWKRAIQHQLEGSGLQSAMKRLTTDMVMNAQQRAAMFEGEALRRQLHKASSDQKRRLLQMRRTEDDYKRAFDEFKKAKGVFSTVLDSWSLGEARMQLASLAKLQQGFQILEATGLKAAAAAVSSAAAETTQSPSSPDRPAVTDGVMVFRHVHEAERFIQEAQKRLAKSLAQLKRQFVTLVRDLANRSRTEHFLSLKDTIQNEIHVNVQPELQEGIIDELEDLVVVNIQTLMFSRIKRQVARTISTRHSGATAFRAIEDVIAKPLLKNKEDHGTWSLQADESTIGDHSSDIQAHGEKSGVDELGFMLRAPIAVIASIPWILGAGIWPFVARSREYHLNKDEIGEQLKKRIVRPFLNQLKAEGQTTLKGMMCKSSSIAREAVEGSLRKEEQRYELERSQKDQPPSPAAVAEAVASLSNFIAAEAALVKLRGYLEDRAHTAPPAE